MIADLFTLLGACAIVFGLYLWSVPLACVVGGLVAIGIGTNLGKQQAHEAEQRRQRGAHE